MNNRAARATEGESARALRAVRRDAVQPDRAVLHDAGGGAGAPARGQGVLSPRRRGDRPGEPDRPPHQDHQMVRALHLLSGHSASVRVRMSQRIASLSHGYQTTSAADGLVISRRVRDHDRGGAFTGTALTLVRTRTFSGGYSTTWTRPKPGS